LFAIGAQVETGRTGAGVTTNEIGALATLTVSLQFTLINVCLKKRIIGFIKNLD
jgi:hypothetical protein